MKKRIFALTLMLVLFLSCSFYASAEKSPPTSFEKPLSPALWQSHESTLEFRWTNPASIIQISMDVNDSEYSSSSFFYLIDWKKNDGSWNVAISPNDPNWDDNLHGQFSGYMPSLLFDENGVAETFFVTWHLDPTLDASSSYDLTNDTYYFRIRYVFESYEGEFEPIYSPYSDVAAIGKDALSQKITNLDAPKELKVAVKKDSNDQPYFQLDWVIPESATAANKLMPVHHIIDYKIGNGEWLSESMPWDGLPTAPSGLLLSTDTFNPVDIGLDDIVIEENIYSFKVAYVCEQPMGAPVISAYSNVASTLMEAYSRASDWAKQELNAANEKGLIPSSLIGVDMTKPITREEFAELAVKLYEKTMDVTATPQSPNPFTDTTNPEILKALEIGVTTGTSATTFEPKSLINREQVSTMLSRAIRKMAPTGDFSTDGAPTFTDQKDISSWALEHVLFMAKLGIIKGTDGKFMPKATTSAQIAQGYANTTREQAIAMSVRAFDKMDEFD